MAKKKIVVIGGGITGLSSAAELIKKGYKVTVIEKKSHLGGMAASFRYKDFTLDYGPHKIYSTLPGIMPYFKKLLGKDCLIIKKKNSVRIFNRNMSFPPNLTQLLTIPPFIIFKLGISYFISLIKKPFIKRIKSYEDYIINGFGRVAYELVFRDSASKVWDDPKKLSEELGRKRIPVPNIITLLKSALLVKKEKPDLSAKHFYYPKQGFRQVSNKFESFIKRNKGKILLNTNIKRIEIKNDKVESISYYSAGSKKLKKTKTDYIISSIYLNDLISYLHPFPSNKIYNAVNKLRFRGLILFYIVVKKKLMKDNWRFFPEKTYIFNRVSDLTSFSKYISPLGKRILVAEITDNPKFVPSTISDEKLSKSVFSDLEKANILKRTDVQEFFIRKAKRVYPIYSLDYKKNLKKVTDYIFGINGLYTIGRQGLFNYNNTDHCIDMSIRTAKHIHSSGTKKQWNKILDFFDTYKIVD